MEIYIHNLRLNDLDSTIAISKRTGKAIKKNETRNEKPDLHFFAEGGDMVNGINNRIAFKAVGSNGRGISISGTIVDIDGVENLKISTAKFGMGMFGFAPKKGKTYQVITRGNGLKR